MTERPRAYDRQGNPVSVEQWALAFEDMPIEARRVALTQVGEVEVSTVWLGYDHAFTGPPQVYETMAFRSGEDADVCERYATEDEARAGHERIVAELHRAERHDVHHGVPGHPGAGFAAPAGEPVTPELRWRVAQWLNERLDENGREP